MTLAREDILPQPHKESRQYRPRPYPGLSFKLSSSVQPSTSVARALQLPGPPHPRAPRPPKSLDLAKLRKRDGGCQVSHTDPFSHTKKSSFCTPAGAAEVINIPDCEQLKLGLGCGSATGAVHRAAPQSWLRLC